MTAPHAPNTPSPVARWSERALCLSLHPALVAVAPAGAHPCGLLGRLIPGPEGAGVAEGTEFLPAPHVGNWLPQQLHQIAECEAQTPKPVRTQSVLLFIMTKWPVEC